MNTEEKINYIHAQYGKQMYQKANSILNDSHEAEDAVQEAMIRLFRVADKIEDVSSTKARILAITVTKNVAIDLWRKKAHAIPVEGELLELEPEKGTTEQLIADKERFSGFIKVFLKMPDAYRDVLRLRCVYELSAEETAQLLGTNANAVNIKLTRARKILKTRYSVIASLVLLFGVGLVLPRTLQLTGGSSASVASTAAAAYEAEAAAESAAEQPALAKAAAETAADNADAAQYGVGAGRKAEREALPETAAAGAAPAAIQPEADEIKAEAAAVPEDAEAIDGTGAARAAESVTDRLYSDTTENGLRMLAFMEGTERLTMYMAETEEALAPAFAEIPFDESKETRREVSVNGAVVELRLVPEADESGAVAYWQYEGQYYALFSPNVTDMEAFVQTVSAYVDYR